MQNVSPPPPFSCTYSPNLPELLRQLGCTIALSTYQAGKLILLSAKNDDELTQLPRNFAKPMGIALHGKKMAIACLDEVIVLA
ncbi:MAG: TIGR03032 family protein, partial [Saprospiraceae bacterium]|nr:TIGR03032 family protein [Saprospiraceae bacterium]